MRLLLDTHSLLWFAGGNDRLSRKAREAIEDMSNAVYSSMASLWEMAIKINIGKLELPKPLGILVSEQIRHNEFAMLRSEVEHFMAYTELPLYHRDPFDRMMIAQAQVENLSVVSKDTAFADYDTDFLW